MTRIAGAQIALRYPRCVDSLVAGHAAVQSAVTGRDWHTDGLRQGKKHSFSLLVGVALSNVLGTDEGNLCIWPGSHRTAHMLMRWPDGKVQREGGSWDEGALPDLGAPVQLRLDVGDVVLAHSELCHCGGPHTGADLRYMLYYRVRHTGWADMVRQQRLLRDMWCDLEGTWPVLGHDERRPEHDDS